MNNQRRKQLNHAIGLIQEFSAQYDTARTIIHEVAEEERESYDNMTEGLQASERGERMNEIADLLESRANELDQLDLSDLIIDLEHTME